MIVHFAVIAIGVVLIVPFQNARKNNRKERGGK